jgi:hypothetical protein
MLFVILFLILLHAFYMTGICHPLSFALPSNTSRGSANYEGPSYVFLPPPVTSSILTPRILNALFLNILSFCSSCEVRDQVSLQ